MMHELIDREDPKCLYCNSDCDFKHDGFFPAGISNLYYELEILTCRKCKEIFEIHWIDDAGEFRYLSFVFTCKDIVVLNRYSSGYSIGGKEFLYVNWSAGKNPDNFIPAFPVDFSNKNKLYKKLKTYVVFS